MKGSQYDWCYSKLKIDRSIGKQQHTWHDAECSATRRWTSGWKWWRPSTCPVGLKNRTPDEVHCRGVYEYKSSESPCRSLCHKTRAARVFTPLYDDMFYKCGRLVCVCFFQCCATSSNKWGASSSFVFLQRGYKSNTAMKNFHSSLFFLHTQHQNRRTLRTLLCCWCFCGVKIGFFFPDCLKVTVSQWHLVDAIGTTIDPSRGVASKTQSSPNSIWMVRN